MVICEKCGIAWAQRRFPVHYANCRGGIEGFKPIQVNKRYVYQCEKCGTCIRKEHTAAHKQKCSQRPPETFEKESSQHEKHTIEATVIRNSQATEINAEALSIRGIMSQQGIEEEEDQKDQKDQVSEKFFFEKELDLSKQALFICPKGKQPIMIQELEQASDEDEPHPPLAPTLQALNLEAIRAETANMVSTEIQFKLPRLQGFRRNRLQNQPGLPLLIEMFSLSCLLRLVGRYTRQDRWEQGKHLIKKEQFWHFLKDAQPWIVNNPNFASLAKQKIALYDHDDSLLFVKNFDQLYLRLKELIEHYTIKPEKIEKIFTRPINTRDIRFSRARRCDPQTLIMRRKISKYFSRKRMRWQKAQQLNRRTYGQREYTRLKYQSLRFQVEQKDQLFEMKQTFSKKPSRTHRVEVGLKRQRLMENFCLSIIADDITASVILGQFKFWEKSLEFVEPDQRHLYTNRLPDIPHFQIWYPVQLSVLHERKWFFPTVYYQCQGYFESPIPVQTQDSLFRKVVHWYRQRNLIVGQCKQELEGYDEVRGALDGPYRIQEEEMRIMKKAYKVVINSKVIFPQDIGVIEERQKQSDRDEEDEVIFDERVPSIGNRTKWMMIHSIENKTNYTCCAFCEEEVPYPCPSCKDCLALYHRECKKDIQDNCLCNVQTSRSFREKKMQEAIEDARRYAKKIDLKIKIPPPANQMEVEYQQKNLALNLPFGCTADMWCLPETIRYNQASGIGFLNCKMMKIMEDFATKKYVFPVIIRQVNPIKGRGLFASRDIKEGQIVANYCGTLISQAQTIHRYSNSGYLFNFQEGKTPFLTWNIIPEGVAGIGMFINHSSTPNVEPGRYWCDKGPLILYLAKRKIKRNEEILFDYGANYIGSEKFA